MKLNDLKDKKKFKINGDLIYKFYAVTITTLSTLFLGFLAYKDSSEGKYKDGTIWQLTSKVEKRI